MSLTHTIRTSAPAQVDHRVDRRLGLLAAPILFSAGYIIHPSLPDDTAGVALTSSNFPSSQRTTRALSFFMCV